MKRNLSEIDRSLLTERNRLDIALYAHARSRSGSTRCFIQKGCRGRVFREDATRSGRSAAAAASGWNDNMARTAARARLHVVTPPDVVGGEEEGDLQALEECE